jgi:predicted transposase YdaD
MHEYDVAMKNILTRPGSALLFALTGCSELNWLNVELPKVNNLRVDLLGARPNGQLIHFEFQSRNDAALPNRMGEYLFAIRRRYRRLPRQIVLYVGEKPMRKNNSLAGPDLAYRFHMLDIRDLDGNTFLASPNLSDTVVTILTRIGSEPAVLRQILRRITKAPAEEREKALAELSILAGLRRLKSEIEREAHRMPITEDIMDNELVAPWIKKGIRQGREEGREEGIVLGRAEGQVKLLVGLIRKRFGRVPVAVQKRLSTLSSQALTDVGLRLLDAQSIDELFKD